jgi:hypothetical protein
VSVDQYGLLTGQGLGTAEIAAIVGGMTASLTLEVLEMGPPNQVQIVGEAHLITGRSTQFFARAYDENGFEVPADFVTWQSSNSNVCSVDGNGTVTAVGGSWALITASVNGLQSQPANCFVDGGAEELRKQTPRKLPNTPLVKARR